MSCAVSMGQQSLSWGHCEVFGRTGSLRNPNYHDTNAALEN